MSANQRGLRTEQSQAVDTLLQAHGYADYKWIDPHKIIVAQWVRMKCMLGWCASASKDGSPSQSPLDIGTAGPGVKP